MFNTSQKKLQNNKNGLSSRLSSSAKQFSTTAKALSQKCKSQCMSNREILSTPIRSAGFTSEKPWSLQKEIGKRGMYEYFVAVSMLGILIGAVATAYVSASFGMIIMGIGFLGFCTSLYNLQQEKEQSPKGFLSGVKSQLEECIKHP